MTDRPITIAVDANGADRGPSEVAKGAALAAQHGIRVLLFGPAAELGKQPDGVELIDAPVSIAKAPDPVQAVRRTPQASIVQAVRAVVEGRADALVCGGATGPALAAGLFHIKRGKGVHRPALALLIPVPRAPFLLLDVGANVAVRQEHLVQFAHMGAAFMEVVFGVKNPRVALLSNGEEATKGTAEVVGAHATLAASKESLNFVGNVEGFAIEDGTADVVVTDGFTGNVALKVIEGTSASLFSALKDAASTNSRARMGGLLLRPSVRELRERTHPEEQGGAILLGLRKLMVVPHGSFGHRGYERAIELAAQGVRENVVERTHGRLAAAGVLKKVPAQPGEGVASENARPVSSKPTSSTPNEPDQPKDTRQFAG